MKITSLLFFVSILSLSNLHAQSLTSLRIDPDNARGGKSADLYEKVNFIPLETTKESTFGQVYSLTITEKYFIICDHDTYAVLIFNRNGKFHSKIDSKKTNGYFGKFTINQADKEIILKMGDLVQIYDYDGNFLRKEQILENVGGVHYFNKHAIAYHLKRPLTFSKTNEKKFDLVYSNGYNQQTKTLFPYNPKYIKNDYNLPEYLFSPQDDGSCFFSMPYDYTVSQLSSEGIVQQYKFNFPVKYALPLNFATDSSFTGKRKEYIFGDLQNNGQKIKEIAPIFKDKANDYLLFHAGKISGTFTNTTDFLYSLKTNTLYGLNRILGDVLSANIPVLAENLSTKMIDYQQQTLYTAIPASVLFSIKKEDKSELKYPAELENLFTKGDKTDNPVIIEAKLKNGL